MFDEKPEFADYRAVGKVMPMREILVLYPESDSKAVLAVASQLGLQFGVYVQGLCICPEPKPTIAESFVVGQQAIHEVIHDLDGQARDVAASAEAAFKACLADCRGTGDWHAMDRCAATQDALVQAHHVDLVVLPLPGPDDHAAFTLAVTLLIDGGRPCLFVPGTAPALRQFDRIIVASNGSREANLAMDDALPFLERATQVRLVIVGDTAADTHDHAHAVATHLSRHGVKADVQHLAKERRSVAEAILETCRTFDAQLLVAGAYGHSVRREALFGGVTRAILHQASLPVFMSR